MWNFIKSVKRSQVTQEKKQNSHHRMRHQGGKSQQRMNTTLSLSGNYACVYVCVYMCVSYVVYYIYLFQIYKQVSALHVPTWISSLLFLTLLLEYNCFRRLCSLLLYKEVNQLFVHIHPPPSRASLPLVSHPSRSTQHWLSWAPWALQQLREVPRTTRYLFYSR